MIVFILLCNIVVLLFAIKTKIGLYTIPPEIQWQDAINEFDKNKKAIDELDISDYRLGNDHIYH
ncbi:hypothetical protein MHTCC0001_28280 [Flavobacteriaceae bacterium MHTCC 0001]